MSAPKEAEQTRPGSLGLAVAAWLMPLAAGALWGFTMARVAGQVWSTAAGLLFLATLLAAPLLCVWVLRRRSRRVAIVLARVTLVAWIVLMLLWAVAAWLLRGGT